MSERELFIAALQLPDPAEREAWLDRECGTDVALRQRINVLLRAFEKAGSLLESPIDPSPAGIGETKAAESVSEPDSRLPAETPGTIIGHYKLLEQIGEGGMGTVWMAQQTEPVKRVVALKLIKPGLDSRQIITRFEAERQALALMDHPNIAKVLDAGHTGQKDESGRMQDETGKTSDSSFRLHPSSFGRPYFVMELVKGVPITRYCDDHHLTPRQRLELFVPVCHAVQHAHQKGIIHRDLKPSNVLVALYDDRPVPKVIDFGVAKATGPQLTEQTLHTGFGAVVGTIEYMSPEQAGFNQLDVDTRSDIYSLGVLLYELLAGSPPFSRKELEKSGMLEMLRVIREQEPSKPSTKLSTAEGLPTLAANRGTEPAKLTRLVRGELDWIVMKALEKDRGRRYETANGFAMDLQRYLADEPVLAGPPSAWYRLRKFVRRNKGPVLAAGVFVFLLTAGIVGTTTGLFRALAAEKRAVTERDQKEEARRQTRQALNTLTDEVVEDLLGKQVKLTEKQREFLRKVLAYHAEFAAAKADDPEGLLSKGEGHLHVARIYHVLGQLKEAEASYRDALDIFKKLSADFPDEPLYRNGLAFGLNNVGMLLRETGRTKEAEEAFDETVKFSKELVTAFPGRQDFRYALAVSSENLGSMLKISYRFEAAEKAMREAIALRKQLAAESPKWPNYRNELAQGHLNLGTLLTEMGRTKEAELALQEAIGQSKPLVADYPTDPDFRHILATGLENLGFLMGEIGRLKEAEAPLREALSIAKPLAADFPGRPNFRHCLARCQYNLGVQLYAAGRATEAEAAYREAVVLLQPLVTDYPMAVDFRAVLAHAYNNLGAVLRQTRPKEAEAAYREGLGLRQKLVADFPDWPEYRFQLAQSHYNLGLLLNVMQRPREAEEAWRESLVHYQKLANDHPSQPKFRHQLAGCHFSLGLVLAATNRPKEAQEACREAIALLRKLVADFPSSVLYRSDLAGVLEEFGELLSKTGHGPEERAAYEEGATVLEHLVKDFPTNAKRPFNAACLLCRCVTLAEKDAQLAETERKELAQSYADRAMEMLRQAVARGYKDAAHMKKDTDLDPLRAREDFKKLLADLEAKK
jgi:eukaryotic-like serine/threonine-protein kinase